MWKTVKLGEVLQTGAGGTPLKSKKEFYDGGNIKWLLSGAVCEKEIYSSETYITKAGLENSSAKIFPPNTVLIAMYGATAGQVAILKVESCTNQAVCGIYPSVKYLPEFLYYFLLSYKEKLLEEASGVAQPNLSQIKIKNIPLPIISLAEQQRIVAKLDAAFAEIEETVSYSKQNVANAERLYSYGIDEIFSPLYNLAQPLGNNSEINYGYTAKASFNEGTHKFLRITDIQDNSVDWDGVPFCNIEDTKLPKMLLHDGDIVFARTGATTGKSFLVENPIDAVFASYLIRVSVDRDILLPRYVMHFFQSETYWLQVKEGISGAAQGGFNASKLAELVVPVVPIEEQQNVIDRLDTLYEQATQLASIYEKKLEQQIALKSAILAQELQGEVA